MNLRLELRARTFLLVAAVWSLSGCKLALIVGEGGNVESLSGTRDCIGEAYCLHPVTDPSFSETFTVVPNPGFEFVKWHGGEGFVCANSTNVSCTVALGGDAFAQGIVDSFETAYLMPVFRDVGVDTDGDGAVDRVDDDDDNDGLLDVDDICPLNPEQDCAIIEDAVTVIGRTWAQVDLFLGVTWEEVEAICPGGVCAGVLNGFSMDGWRWAGSEDLNALFNNYLEEDWLGPGPSFFPQVNVNSTGVFYVDGWRPTTDTANQISTGGWLADETGRLGSVGYDNFSIIQGTVWNTGYGNGGYSGGAWFYWEP